MAQFPYILFKFFFSLPYFPSRDFIMIRYFLSSFSPVFDRLASFFISSFQQHVRRNRHIHGKLIEN